MKKIVYILSLCYILVACEKRENLPVSLSVSTEKANYKVGDTVRFTLSGNPDQLVFWSGEESHRYIYRDRTRAESEVIQLSFATNRRYGTDAQQPGSLRLLATQNFNAVYDATGIKPSDWVDITSAFTLSPIQSNDATYAPSGIVNLLALQQTGLTVDVQKPIYFAFKYTGVTGSTQPRWWINAFNINTITSDGQVLTVSGIKEAGWKFVKVLPSSPVTWIFGTDNILKYAGGAAAVGSNQVWAVTAGLNLTSVSPDTGVPLKNMATRMDTYSHVYTKPGKYTVTFVAANANIYGQDQVTKDVTINVAE
ncbi:DUF5017 domain-containing protein [Sphingobacterium spiritivorum]|uniref:DUF5017 domain-containing protein n=1 Tax=Sphingobacterium spiritivorum TaxID=258 RepID=UPI003DA6259D